MIPPARSAFLHGGFPNSPKPLSQSLTPRLSQLELSRNLLATDKLVPNVAVLNQKGVFP